LYRAVHAEEAFSTNSAVTRYHAVRSYKDIIFNDGMMTDVIAAPKKDIVSDSNKGLHRVVLKN
jgi:hypothetical protein